MSGIYKITNKINGKFYIGQTERPLDVRWSEHEKYLRLKKHHNDHLQRSWNKYGEDAFEFSVILKCPAETKALNFWEELFLRDHWNKDYCYNNREGGGSKGKMSAEAKRKMSKARKGKTQTKEHIEKRVKQLRGRKLPKLTGKNNPKAQAILITLADGKEIVFDTVNAAAKYFDVRHTSLVMKIKRGGQWGTDNRVKVQELKGAKIKYINK